jgi:hypothetical protein
MKWSISRTRQASLPAADHRVGLDLDLVLRAVERGDLAPACRTGRVGLSARVKAALTASASLMSVTNMPHADDVAHVAAELLDVALISS